jgi:hypothetical protein
MQIKILMKKIINVFIIFFLNGVTSNLYSQNIFLEPIKKVDEFTKTLTIDLYPYEEIMFGKKISKFPLPVESGKEFYMSASIGVRYIKRENGNEFYLFSVKKSVDLGCLSKYDGKMMVLFEDGDTITLKQQSDTDCGSEIKVNYYFGSPEVIESNSMENLQIEQSGIVEKFRTKKISKIRVYGTKFYDDIEFRPEITDIYSKMISKILEIQN